MATTQEILSVALATPGHEPGDLSNQYNTQLSTEDEVKFRAWQQANPRLGNTYDYDARGFWKSGAGQAANGHGADTWKKPNHPTFSTGSQYSTPQSPGGEWSQGADKTWQFNASSANLRYQDANDLNSYWKRVEAPAGNKLVLPAAKPGAKP